MSAGSDRTNCQGTDVACGFPAGVLGGKTGTVKAGGAPMV